MREYALYCGTRPPARQDAHRDQRKREALLYYLNSTLGNKRERELKAGRDAASCIHRLSLVDALKNARVAWDLRERREDAYICQVKARTELGLWTALCAAESSLTSYDKLMNFEAATLADLETLVVHLNKMRTERMEKHRRRFPPRDVCAQARAGTVAGSLGAVSAEGTSPPSPAPAPAAPGATPVLAAVRAHLANDLDAPSALSVIDRWAENTRLRSGASGSDSNAGGEIKAIVNSLLGVAL